MYPLVNIKRDAETLILGTGKEGLTLMMRCQLLAAHEKSWLVAEYPDALIKSAEQALTGDSSFDRCFQYYEAHVQGRFHAHPKGQGFVELFITIEEEFFHMILRASEVHKIVRILREYFGVAPAISVLLVDEDPVFLQRMERLLAKLNYIQLKSVCSASEVAQEQYWAHVIVFGKLPECGMSADDILPRIDREVTIIAVYPDDALAEREHDYVSRTSMDFDNDLVEAIARAWQSWSEKNV